MDLNLKHRKKHNYNNVPPENPFNDEVEKQHFYSILAAFKYYKTAALNRVERREQFVDTLPARHQARLLHYRCALQQMRAAIQRNHQLICLLVEGAQSIFENVPSQELLLQHHPGDSGAPVPKPHDIEKVHYVLKQVVRDWSSAGALERMQCYSPVIQQIQQEFPDPSGVSVLVPGAGLGRLAYEIAVLGYICQGNEFSFFMIFASNFVLNKCHEINQYSIHPWAHQLVNNLTCEEQLRNVSFPDTSPAALQGQEFSMVAGDFVEVYTTEAEWDCVATCFFIDCAPNVIDFIETIYHILKPGGIWVNIGPLLYHFCDTDTEGSIEPPFDILCDIIKDVGFTLEKSQTGVKTKYFHNPSSMLQHEYDSVFLVCRKPLAHPHAHPDTHTDTQTDTDTDV